MRNSASVTLIVFLATLIGGLQRNTLEKTLGAQAHVVLTPLEEIVARIADLATAQPTLQVDGEARGPAAELLRFVEVTPVGQYALQPRFSDGHESGIFSWDYLYKLGAEADALWARYEERLRAAGVDRDAPMPSAGGGACGHSH